MILAVAEEDDRLGPGAVLAKGSHAFANGVGDGGALFGNEIGVERPDALAEGLVIQRQRTLEEGAAGKSHETEPIRLAEAQQVEGGQFGLRQPVGFHVIAQHRSRHVEAHDDVESRRGGFLVMIAPLRPGEREQERDHGHSQQHALGNLAAGGKPDGQLPEQARLHERLGSALLPPPRPPQEPGGQRREDQRQQQKLSGGPIHGSFLHTV